jgi:hypothetical protein
MYELIRFGIIPASTPGDWRPPGVALHIERDDINRHYGLFYVEPDQLEVFLGWAVSVGLPEETAKRIPVLITLEMAED